MNSEKDLPPALIEILKESFSLGILLQSEVLWNGSIKLHGVFSAIRKAGFSEGRGCRVTLRL
jgi:hypothetical protein